jgi:hypothetical protein
MAKKPTPSRRDRKPLLSPAPEIVEAAAAAAAPNAADAIVAPPLEDTSAPVSAATPEPEPEPELQAAATESAFAMTPAVTPLAVAEAVAPEATEAALPAQPALLVAAGAMAATVPPMPAALTQAGEAYLHAWLDCQREAAQFLERQLEYGRRAQRLLSACQDVADAARIQRDWSAEALKACLDEAACLPVRAAKFWTIGLQLGAQAKPATSAPPAR